MSDNLKKFVADHRKEFDTSEPGKDLWEKIDAQMEAKNSARISSKWLSKLKHLGFSASVLVIAVYFIASNLNNSSEMVSHRKDPGVGDPVQNLKAEQDEQSGENNTAKQAKDLKGNDNKTQNPIAVASDNEEPGPRSNHSSLPHGKTDSVSKTKSFETNISGPEKIKPESFVGVSPKEHEKKENIPAVKSKKNKINKPGEPSEMNRYSGTLYDSCSFCALLRAYKFTGKANMNKSGWNANGSKKKEGIGTINCNRLEHLPNLTAVWLKGKTDKEITISVKKRFKNIWLVKSNGRKLNPEAISHYYPGLNVISDFAGKQFKIIFKDKVELLLFFEDAEEGDKIVVDGIIEATVKR